jgi:hypothetical protein
MIAEELSRIVTLENILVFLIDYLYLTQVSWFSKICDGTQFENTAWNGAGFVPAVSCLSQVHTKPVMSISE